MIAPCSPPAHLHCCGITGFTCKRNRQVSSSSKKLILFHSAVGIRSKFRLYRSLHSVSQVQFSLGVWNLYRRYFFQLCSHSDSPNSFNHLSCPLAKGIGVPRLEYSSRASVFLPSCPRRVRGERSACPGWYPHPFPQL